MADLQNTSDGASEQTHRVVGRYHSRNSIARHALRLWQCARLPGLKAPRFAQARRDFERAAELADHLRDLSDAIEQSGLPGLPGSDYRLQHEYWRLVLRLQEVTEQRDRAHDKLNAWHALQERPARRRLSVTAVEVSAPIEHPDQLVLPLCKDDDNHHVVFASPRHDRVSERDIGILDQFFAGEPSVPRRDPLIPLGPSPAFPQRHPDQGTRTQRGEVTNVGAQRWHNWIEERRGGRTPNNTPPLTTRPNGRE
jgi:hypothetical protein